MSSGRSTISPRSSGRLSVGRGVAGMVDRSDDKTAIGGRLGGVVVADKAAAMPVRDDDQRQSVAGDRAILDPGQVHPAEIDRAGRRGARIPDRAVQPAPPRRQGYQ